MMFKTGKIVCIVGAAIILLGSALCLALVIGNEEGMWPANWPKELESYRKQARTLEIAAGNQETVYEICFEKREDFEKIWPVILKLKSKGAPLKLRSIEKPSSA